MLLKGKFRCCAPTAQREVAELLIIGVIYCTATLEATFRNAPSFSRTSTMVQTRSTAKKIVSGIVHGVLPTNTTVAHPRGNDVPAPAKKPRREDTAPPKKRRRREPGEPCRLNLDVLFLVRGHCSLFFRPFTDRRDGTRLRHTSTL